MSFLFSSFQSQEQQQQKFWQRKRQAYYLERQILQKSGLQLDTELKVFDVPIIFQQADHYIHTYLCGEENTKTLVLLHGYGGSSILFYSMLKDLSQKYKVYCIDLLGMGLSSKLDFPCKDTQETIDYFVESIEKWREAMDIKEFDLGGLSFGGYMSTHYAIKYQERVKRLFLISPAGLTKGTPQIDAETWSSNLPFMKKIKFHLALKAWEEKTSLSDYYSRYSLIANFVIKRDMHRKFGDNGKESELADLLYKLFTKIMKMGSGSDRAVYYILKSPRAYAHVPLEDLIREELHIPVICYYGERDWMDWTGAVRIKKSRKANFDVKRIENSGHLISMNNPTLLAQDILSYFIV